MKWVLGLVLVGCSPNFALPTSQELMPFADEWNFACGSTIFVPSQLGEPDHRETRLKFTDRTDDKCPNGGVVYGGGYASDVYMYNCFWATADDATKRTMILHELGHVAYLGHPDGKGHYFSAPPTFIDDSQIMSYGKATGIGPGDIEQLKIAGWPCVTK